MAIDLQSYDDEELIDIAQDYAKEHNSFNTEFICSLEDALGEYDSLTCAQRDALENIIRRYRMIK